MCISAKIYNCKIGENEFMSFNYSLTNFEVLLKLPKYSELQFSYIPKGNNKSNWQVYCDLLMYSTNVNIFFNLEAM